MFPMAMLGFVLFVIASFRPVFAVRGSQFAVRSSLFANRKNDLRSAIHAYTLSMHEALRLLPHRLATKLVCLTLVFVTLVDIPLVSLAGDTGTPATSQSDENYFYYMHSDHLGSSHILTEGNSAGGKHSGIFYNRGTLIQRIEYAPFGQELYVLNPNLKFDPRYTGQSYDIETGLYYYKSRYYNPAIARFIQPDTVVPSAKDLQAYNKYSYVINNPLKFIDPSGHGFWSWFKKIFGAFIGALIAAFITIITLGAMGVVGATIGAMIANASLGQLVLAGAVGGLIGGAIGGGISGGLGKKVPHTF